MDGQTAALAGVDIKKAWANLLIRQRRQLRRILKLESETRYIGRKLKDALATETSKTFKNQYRIAELQKGISEMDNCCNTCRNELAASGGLLFDILPMYEDSGASDHDFAQLINCNIKRMEQIRTDFDKGGTQGHSFFVDAIFVHHAEQPIEREKEDFVVFSDLPFFDAMVTHFMKQMEANSKLRQAVHDKTDEIFPELRAYQYIVKESPDGEVSLEKYYPPLKLMKS